MTIQQAVKAVVDSHKYDGDYDIKTGFAEIQSDGIAAVEVWYKWRLNAWDHSVHRIDHCVETPYGIAVESSGYSLDYLLTRLEAAHENG